VGTAVTKYLKGGRPHPFGLAINFVTMDDFELEPAKGDRYIEESDLSAEEVEGEEVVDEAKTKSAFHVSGVSLFGGRELHEDGTPHYHAVMSFDHKEHWPDARKKLTIDGDTSAIRIEKPQPRQKVSDFLETRWHIAPRTGTRLERCCHWKDLSLSRGSGSGKESSTSRTRRRLGI